jgi:hypothetical protein
MENDSWRHWRAFSALMTPAFAGASRPAGASDPGFVPWISAGESFADAARRFVEAAHGVLGAGTAGAGPAAAGQADPSAAALAAARRFADVLRERFANFRMPWNPGSAGRDPFAAAGAAGAGTAGYVPALGAAREHQQRAERLADAWRAMEEAQTRLQRLWSDALQEAANGFAHDLAGKPPASHDPAALREVYDRWIEAAETAYARTAHGETFCGALADFVNASSAWRKDQQAGIEQWAKQFDLPTRSEVNSLAQRLKAIEAALAAATRAPAATAVPAATSAPAATAVPAMTAARAAATSVRDSASPRIPASPRTPASPRKSASQRTPASPRKSASPPKPAGGRKPAGVRKASIKKQAKPKR